MLGKSLFRYRDIWDLDDTYSILKACRDLDCVHLKEVRFRRADGSDGYLNVHLTIVRNSEKEMTGYLLLATDITQQKLLEAQLLQAQKLESLGHLAAGIAHEINTPIQFIGDNTRFLEVAFKRLDLVLDKSSQLLKEFNEGNPLDQLIAEVEETIATSKLDYMRQEIPLATEESLGGVNQVATIVKAMKQFSHPGQREKSLTDLNGAIMSTINVARNEWKYVADLDHDLDEDLPMTPCLHIELNQVLLNIIINAAHAIKEKMGIDVESRMGEGSIFIIRLPLNPETHEQSA